MAVVMGKSSLIGDYLAQVDNPDPELARGRPIFAVGVLTNAADDSNTSMYELARIPSHAILTELTKFDVENWGFAQTVIGTKTDTDALLDVATNAATTQAPIVFGDANHGKRLWEVLGLAEDPKTEISLWVHAEADATAAGNMPFQIVYLAR